MAQVDIAKFFGKVKNDNQNPNPTKTGSESEPVSDDEIQIVENEPEKQTVIKEEISVTSKVTSSSLPDKTDVNVNNPALPELEEEEVEEIDNEGDEQPSASDATSELASTRMTGLPPTTPLRQNNSANGNNGTPASSQRERRSSKRPHPPDTPVSASKDYGSTPESGCKSASKRARTASAERRRQEGNRLKEKQREDRERAKAEIKRLKEEKERERLREKEQKELERLREKEQKEQERLREKEQKEQERLREKEERERKKAEEKAERERQKAEKEAEREKQRLEKERQKAEQQEIKEREKQERERERKEKEAIKEEERKKREEERKKKEDERKEREDKIKREEAEKMAKLERQRDLLKNFIAKGETQKPQRQSLPSGDIGGRFQPFHLKEDMVLASVHRRSFDASEKRRVDECLQYTDPLPERSNLYIAILATETYQPKKFAATKKPAVDEDIEILGDKSSDSDSAKRRMKVKFLQFHDNRRPAYYGTFRKLSELVTGRRPFGKQPTVSFYPFDYDVDSDDEWEEEPEDADECVSDDDKDDNDDEKLDDDDDDGFFVQHGYLSEGEGEDDAQEEIDEKTRRERLDAKARAWAAEKLGKDWKKLHPIIIGPIWQGEDKEPELIEKLMTYRVWGLSEQPPLTSYNLSQRQAEQHAQQLLQSEAENMAETPTKIDAAKSSTKTIKTATKSRPPKTPSDLNQSESSTAKSGQTDCANGSSLQQTQTITNVTATVNVI